MSNVNIIKSTADTVTISRSDWEALLDQIEERQDFRAIEKSEGSLAHRVTYTADEAHSMIIEGVNAVTILRKRRGLTQSALAAAAGVSKSYLSEIETGSKPGSVGALQKLAKALNVKIDDLAI